MSVCRRGRDEQIYPFARRIVYIHAMADHIDRYVPAETNGGWGFATAVIFLAIVLIAGVTYIHKQTYRHPTDVTWHGRGSGDAAAPEHASSTAH